MPTPPRHLGSLILACLAMLVAAGCSTVPERGDTTLDRAESAYRRGDFETASQLARSVEASSTGTTREEAAYVRGLADARTGRIAEARGGFEIAARSNDPDLADRARRSLEALEGAAAPPPRTAAPEIASRGGYTVQAGAYSRESTARTRAAELETVVRGTGYGPAMVRRISSRRGALWAVQIGRFPDRRQAGAARDRLGHPEWAIEAIGES